MPAHWARVEPALGPWPGCGPCDKITGMSAIGRQPGRVGVADLVELAAAEQPDRLALVESGGRSLTWAELEVEVARVTTGLGAQGVVAGHRVMIAIGNRLEFVTTYLAVLRAQAVAVPVDPHSEPAELARMLADSGARLVVADGNGVVQVRLAVPRTPDAVTGGAPSADPSAGPRVVVVGAPVHPGEHEYAELRAAPPTLAPPLLDPEHLAVLLYTSGASGRPRAAMLTHRALLANIDQVAGFDPPLIRGDDVVLGVLPLFHVYGLGAVLGGALRQHAKLLLVESFDPHATLDVIDDEACSVVPVAPPVVQAWLGEEDLEARLGPVRVLLSGSAPLGADMVAELRRRTGLIVHQGYGLTEAAPVVTSTLSSTTARPGSVGAPLPGLELRLVDEAGTPVTDGDPGEIEIRGPNLFSGYWPDGVDAPAADGWWATGDLGYLDDTGDLRLLDPADDVVFVSGFPVYPAEVEDSLLELDEVGEAAVIGVSDVLTGHAVVAYLVPADGALPADFVARAEEHCRERLAPFKRPTRFESVEALPRTFAGRVKKGRLRSLDRHRRDDAATADAP